MVMMAGAMRVAVSFAVACAKDDGDLDLRARCRSRPTTFRYFPISLVTGLVAGVPDADCGQDRPEGAGEGQVTGPDREPGPLALPRGRGGEGGVTGDAPGHPGPGGPGREFLPDQVRGPGAEHRPRAGAGAAQRRLASRSAVSDPSHRHLYSEASSGPG